MNIQPGICPKCGSDEIEYYDLQYDLGQECVLTQAFKCNKCGIKATENYAIQFLSTTIKGDS